MSRFEVPTEEQEQEALFRWIAFQSVKYPELKLMIHIPNEGKRSKAEGARLKRIGLRPGVPDLILPIPKNGKGGLFIELKRQKGGRVSENQKKWIEELERNGNVASVCYGWLEAAVLIARYIGMDSRVISELYFEN